MEAASAAASIVCFTNIAGHRLLAPSPRQVLSCVIEANTGAAVQRFQFHKTGTVQSVDFRSSRLMMGSTERPI